MRLDFDQTMFEDKLNSVEKNKIMEWKLKNETGMDISIRDSEGYSSLFLDSVISTTEDFKFPELKNAYMICCPVRIFKEVLSFASYAKTPPGVLTFKCWDDKFQFSILTDSGKLEYKEYKKETNQEETDRFFLQGFTNSEDKQQYIESSYEIETLNAFLKLMESVHSPLQITLSANSALMIKQEIMTHWIILYSLGKHCK